MRLTRFPSRSYRGREGKAIGPRNQPGGTLATRALQPRCRRHRRRPIASRSSKPVRPAPNARHHGNWRRRTRRKRPTSFSSLIVLSSLASAISNSRLNCIRRGGRPAVLGRVIRADTFRPRLKHVIAAEFNDDTCHSIETTGFGPSLDICECSPSIVRAPPHRFQRSPDTAYLGRPCGSAKSRTSHRQ